MNQSASPVRILIGFKLVEALRDVLDGVSGYVKLKQLNWQLQCVDADQFGSMLNRQSAHAVISVVGSRSQGQIQKLIESGLPAVNMLQDLCPAVPSVISDDLAIGRAAAKHLLSRGFGNLAYLGFSAVWSRAREQGYKAALAEAGQTYAVCKPVAGMMEFRKLSSVKSNAILQRWIESLPKPVAITACCDGVARMLQNACDASRLKVPETVAILGIDNIVATCELASVPLSSVAQDFPRLGFEAAKQLHGLLLRKPPLKRCVLVPPGSVVVRRSTDVLVFDDEYVTAAMRFIHDRAADSTGMKELLQHVPVSRRWLDQRFKALVGHTASQELRLRRVHRIRDLLLHTDLSVKQIAQRTAFSSTENMSRFFRDAFDMPPQAYRVRHAIPRATGRH